MYALYAGNVRFPYNGNRLGMVDYSVTNLVIYAFFKKNKKFDIPFWPANR